MANEPKTPNTALNLFIGRTFLASVPVILFFALSFFYIIFIKPKSAGDLNGMIEMAGDTVYDVNIHKPRLEEFMVRQYSPGAPASEVITIGDSFSNYKIGPNLYINYLAHELGDTVVNIGMDFANGGNPFQALSYLDNTGFFESHPEVKTVIAESAERYFDERWLNADLDADDINPRILYSTDNKKVSLWDTEWRIRLGKIMSDPANWIKFRLNLGKSSALTLKLDREMFSTKENGDRLIYYFQDTYPRHITRQKIEEIKLKISDLHDRLAAKGVNLIVLIAADKYEVYSPFAARGGIVKEAPLSRYLSEFDSIPYIVNPLSELRRHIDAGEKDIYIADDTHWSYKGHSIVARMLAKKIRNQ
ncbi:MAG: hypothetical protein K2M87_02555 [Muribaculaceae bacterium]|nr:hypothetical protein [Muribaculaceae bacterium]